MSSATSGGEKEGFHFPESSTGTSPKGRSRAGQLAGHLCGDGYGRQAAWRPVRQETSNISGNHRRGEKRAKGHRPTMRPHGQLQPLGHGVWINTRRVETGNFHSADRHKRPDRKFIPLSWIQKRRSPRGEPPVFLIQAPKGKESLYSWNWAARERFRTGKANQSPRRLGMAGGPPEGKPKPIPNTKHPGFRRRAPMALCGRIHHGGFLCRGNGVDFRPPAKVKHVDGEPGGGAWALWHAFQSDIAPGKALNSLQGRTDLEH